MSTTDTCVTIAPWFRVHPGKMEEFKKITAQMVANTLQEPGCHYYGFAYNGDLAFCREAYRDGEAALEHTVRVGELLGKALQISALERIELIGTEAELSKLRGPMAALNPVCFVLETGFGVRV